MKIDYPVYNEHILQKRCSPQYKVIYVGKKCENIKGNEN